MNLIQQAVERAKQLEDEGGVVVPVTQTGPRPESRTGLLSASTGPRIGLASLPHIEPVAARGPMPVLLVLLVSVLALGGGALLYFFLAKSQAIESSVVSAVNAITAPAATKTVSESPAALPAAVVSPSPAKTAATAAPAAAIPAAAAATSAAAPLDEARATVEAWARAWSERNVETYLGFYGQAFRPDRGQSRAAWEASRRQAIEKKNVISVSLRNLKLRAQPGDRVTVRFLQDYSADTYRENGTAKTLVLAREGGNWRIVAESIGAARGSAR